MVERKIIDPKEIERQMDDDFDAVLNMMSEGSPDYAPFEEDEAPEEIKREEAKAKDLH